MSHKDLEDQGKATGRAKENISAEHTRSNVNAGYGRSIARLPKIELVMDQVIARFRGRDPFHHFEILPEGRAFDYRAHVFYKNDRDVFVCRNSELECEIIDYVYAVLERTRQEYRDETEVAFEFDSHENVRRCFGGYLGRLR